MSGYKASNISGVIENLCTYLLNPQLPVLQIKEMFSRLSARLPKEISTGIEKILKEVTPTNQNNQKELEKGADVGKKVTELFTNYLKSVTEVRRKEFTLVADPLIQLALKYELGLSHHKDSVFSQIFRQYLDVEKYFQTSRESYISDLRQLHKSNLKKIFELELSHVNCVSKNELISAMIDKAQNSEAVHQFLVEISELTGSDKNNNLLLFQYS